MSGLAWSRLYLAFGWIGTVIGLAAAHWALASAVGGLLLICYGLFGIDVTRPAPKRKSNNDRDPATLQKTRFTNVRG